ncbi:hypothetical protein BMETH_1194_0 [methanotrophic bacterial endosymbiont of Bathymodiolus sp.]|nr:hypothetical protein BMETH_1194_0 [methanotrophic bacterial endosymbiont of Bathymodiolus sp.]
MHRLLSPWIKFSVLILIAFQFLTTHIFLQGLKHNGR